jgi:pimeloyl-ACP methyl ester carboxylesterase
VYLFGASAGALIAVKALEQYPGTFSGGLALCGPIGDFPSQINYVGDFRAVFDCFFAGLIPGSVIDVPSEVVKKWDSVYEPKIQAAVQLYPAYAKQMLKVTRAPFERSDPSTIEETVLGLLWYNVFASADAEEKLGGQPFNNTTRVYSGSDNDTLLNNIVFRAKAESAGLSAMKKYQTSGRLSVPLVTMHTTGDEIVPVWHQHVYSAKVEASGSSPWYYAMTIERYGHCNINASEVLSGFLILLHKVQLAELVSGRVVPKRTLLLPKKSSRQR